MQDHYKTLGVDRNANPDAIKKAYRQKASLYHPDKEGGSKVKFQEVEEAYRTLSDPNKRQQYDNPGPFGSGGPGFSGFGRHETPFDMDAIFNMFGARFHHGQQPQRRVQMQLWVTIQDVARGGPRTVTIGTQHGTQAVEIEIPRGIEDGDNVQYNSIGPGGADLLVIFRIHPNPKYQRHGQNIIMEQTISVWDLILGSTVDITDVLGNRLELVVPAGTQPSTLLRIRERGLPHRSLPTGDLLVKIQASIPQNIDPELLTAIDKNRHQ
jgi:DnaJ-class molecular chaperone